ncbi:hypothetical protein RLQ69_001796 [Campylobacter jejuni]|uniref:Emm-like protein n=1 Tax=Campylobacter jejuni TaxID=197 RepID=A0A690UZR4_CAMJU|nr:hypothetical protein [Campylobacter jejuni]EAJ5194507.1 hypothetical protein [Campylobacter jejuni]EAK0574117.1 hypothetical protein [Campylobacter jejuni]EDP7703034.1 hypothetical protein [Campylobacter jejuni]EDP8234649.1 hypothetical protein [Campylobacter jejuni]EFV4333612.1 hypothetical protein [Campylobacter jejuni]
MKKNTNEQLEQLKELNQGGLNQEIEDLTKRALAIHRSIQRVKHERSILNQDIKEYQSDFDEIMEKIAFLKEPNLFNKKGSDDVSPTTL